MTRPDIRVTRETDQPWHMAINAYDAPYGFEHARSLRPPVDPAADGKAFMYEAKRMAGEVPRLALLFAMEREGTLPKMHHQCSRDHQGAAVPDNHLTCALGVTCRACPHLLAIDAVPERVASYRPIVKVPVTGEERDVMKAWTCATHIAMRGGDVSGEGYIRTVDDQMFWKNVYESLSAPQWE